jgi:hypothetical protein
VKTLLEILLGLGVISLGALAQWYRYTRDALADYVLIQSRWIDEIIEALENPDEDSGNESLDGLLDKRGPWRRLLDSGKVRIRG